MLIALISTPIITRLVDPTEYGQLSIFGMYVGIAEMVLCLGLDQALVRYYYEKKETGYKSDLLFKCIKLPIIITFGSSVIFTLAVQFDIIHFEFDTFISALLCVCVLIQVIYRFSLLILRLEYNSKMYSTVNVIRKAAFLLLTVAFAVIFKDHYLTLLVIATVSSVFLSMLISIFKQPAIWNPRSIKDKSCTTSNAELLKYAFPYIVSMGVTQIFQAIDKISLNMYRSYAEVGIYASTMTLISIFNIIQTTFNALWAPMQVEHYTNDPDDHSFYQKGNQIITVIMFFIGLSLILVKGVFAILLGEKYREAAYILPFLIFNPIMYTVSETTVGGLVFKKKSNMQVVVAIGACLTNIIGNTLLVPKLGCQGAAISTGVSYIVFFTLRTFISNKYFYTDFKLPKFYLLTGITCVYAFYNTFWKFSALSLIGYFLCLILMFYLYRSTIQWGMHYLMDLFVNRYEILRSRKKRNENK